VSAVRIDATKTVASLRNMNGGIVQAAALILKSAIEDTVSRAKATTAWKDRSGETRKSIVGSRTGFGTGIVTAGGASRFLENGTRAHIIEAKRAKALKFSVNGQMLFRRRVQHPGTKGAYFLTQARNAAQQDIAYAAEIFLGRVVR